ncbi:hypothetical protein NCPPB940_17290 [Xanthomonas hortorum pv. taraxaci]|nr:hypothetical protein NCPPB940_17290 [Xanthomonas hortorum pv. taraxaci]CAD0322938.1 hypothetical protein NCPPB940_17290 [Xanthomonas hortorum pv. taraxaci]
MFFLQISHLFRLAPIELPGYLFPMVVSKFWKLGGGRCVPSEGAESGHAVQGSAGTSELSKPARASTAVRTAKPRRAAEKQGYEARRRGGATIARAPGYRKAAHSG